MKIYMIAVSAILLSGCSAINYDAEKIKYFGEERHEVNASVAVGEVRYLPPSGIGQRSVSVSGGLLMLFTDASREVDVAIDKMARIEIERALKASTSLSTSTGAVCSLNADVLYVKSSKLATQTTEVRYTLLGVGSELNSGKVETKTPYPFEMGLRKTKPATEIDMITTGIHQNVREFLTRPEVKSALEKKCSS